MAAAVSLMFAFFAEKICIYENFRYEISKASFPRCNFDAFLYYNVPISVKRKVKISR